MRLYPMGQCEVESEQLYKDVKLLKSLEKISEDDPEFEDAYIRVHKEFYNNVRRNLEIDNLICIANHKHEIKTCIVMFDKKSNGDDIYPVNFDENNIPYIEIEN